MPTQVLVPYMHKYDVIYTITSIIVYQLSHDMSTEYNTSTPVKSHRTDTNYNKYQIQYKLNNVRKTTRLNAENTMKIPYSGTPSSQRVNVFK